jgi:polar amino acid transport system substrate-binding protein
MATTNVYPVFRPTLRHRLVTAAVGVSVIATIVGCGSSEEPVDAAGAETVAGSENVAGHTDPSAPLHNLLPTAIADTGTLRVASYAGYPPFESFAEDGKSIVGLDFDLAKALSSQLGVAFAFQNTSFDSIIPGLAADRYDMAMSAMSDTAERQKQVDFVDYAMGGSAILVSTENPDNIATTADLCGKTVGVHKGTTDVEDANKISQQCEADGKPPLEQAAYPNDGQMILALETKRANAAFTDAIAGKELIAASDGKLQVLLPPFNKSPFGIVIPKGETQLAEAIQKALQSLNASGEYRAIFEKYGIPAAALTEFPINGATG